MSLKDAGVEPTIFLCSSTDTYCGTDEINVVETMTIADDDDGKFAAQVNRRLPPILSPAGNIRM